MTYKSFAIIAIVLSACATTTVHGKSHHAHSDGHSEVDHSHISDKNNASFDAMPPGSNQRLRSPITISDGLEVIISDVVIPPNATVPAHYHPGEEFLYVIEGSAIHVESGQED